MTNPTSSPQSCSVTLFGGPRVSGPTGPIGLSPTQLALVTVVFAEQQIGRLQIAAILWSDGDEPRVRHRLRQLLHQTNSKLGACIRSDADDLRAWDAFPCDVAHFRQALAESRLRDAASLLSTGFAPSRPRTVGRRFEEWAEEFERSLRRTLRTKAAGVWSEATHDARWEAAQDAAEALYLAEPEDVEAVSKVMEARARLGRLGAAEAAYAAYVETLDGAAPRSELRRQIEALRALSSSDQGARTSTPGPFVGRSQALREGRAALDQVGEGRFAFVLVTGEPGIGKTRLMQELQRDAVLRNLRCLHASPVELEQRIPLNPLLDALQAIDLRPHLEGLGRPWSSVIGSVLPSGSYGEWAEEIPPIQESRLPRRLLDAFTLLLESIAREHPTVFFLDDLHWADATTVAVLQFSQRRWTKGSFGIIASLRPELTTEDHPAGKYVLEGDELGTCRIHLDDLSDREAEKLVGGIALGVAAPVKQLCALAGPHPLYLTELTRDYLAGRFRLPDPPDHDVTIPISLQQILRSKISGISPRAFRVAGLLAVGARAIRLSDLPTLAGLAFHECIESIEELERGRLVEVRRDRVRISHDLFRSALYNHMSEARRAMLHKAIADHLIERAQEEACGGLAIHLARAGESDAAAQYGWQAATRAWDSGAMAEAAYFYELVTDNEREPERRADAMAGLAQALHLTRDLRRANPALELAASRLRERGRLDRARRLDVHRVEGLAAVGAAPVADLVGRLEAIKAEARDHNDWEAVALALNSALRLRNRTGDLRGINDVFDEMREAAEQGSPAAALVCHSGLAMQAMFGDPASGLASARRAVSLKAPSADYRLTALIRLLVVLQYQGRVFLPEAAAVLEEARLLAERSGDRWARFGIENNYALAVLDAGDADSARELMAEAGAILGTADLDIPRFNLANNQAEVELASEDFDAAFAWYVKAGRYVGPNSPAYAQDLVNAGLGLCALQMGNLSEARRRELDLGPPPVPWFYDPTTILTFRAKLLERRGERLAALALLSEHVESLRERLVFAWMKLSALLVRMETKECRWDSAQEHAAECRDSAITLRLPRRAAEFSRLMKNTTTE